MLKPLKSKSSKDRAAGAGEDAEAACEPEEEEAAAAAVDPEPNASQSPSTAVASNDASHCWLDEDFAAGAAVAAGAKKDVSKREAVAGATEGGGGERVDLEAEATEEAAEAGERTVLLGFFVDRGAASSSSLLLSPLLSPGLAGEAGPGARPRTGAAAVAGGEAEGAGAQAKLPKSAQSSLGTVEVALGDEASFRAFRSFRASFVALFASLAELGSSVAPAEL